MLITAMPAHAGTLRGVTDAPGTELGPVPPALFDQVQDGGTVRVNVVTDRRTDLVSASEAGQTLVSYDTLPLVTLRVDATGLQQLNNKPGVASVTEDTPVPPTLNESTVKIGSDKTATAGKTGVGTTLAILDTGVATEHPFLAGRVKTEACFSVNDESYGATSLCPDGTPQQEGPGSADAESGPCAALGAGCSHGTHVAGIAAGDGTGIGGAPTRGVAPGADIIAVQVFSRFDSDNYCGAGNSPCVLSFTSSQLKGLEKVLALKKAGTDIIAANMSLGSGRWTTACTTDPRKMVIDSLLAEGVATVVAAGNNGYGDAVNAPGCIPSAITVGSTTDDDQLSTFSNRGPLLDLLAPGTGIVSSVPGGGYASKNGTSMAAPHVAGALAVLRQTFPEKSVTELEAILKSSGGTVTYTGAATPRIQLDTAALGGGGGGTDPDVDPKLHEFSNWNAMVIPDSGIVQSTVQVEDSGQAPSTLQVYVDIHHDWTGDLEIDLLAPDGSVYPLRRVHWSDDIKMIHEVYTVDASSEEALGTWTLRVNDYSAGSGGELVGWGMRFPWFHNWTETPIPDLGTAELPIAVSSQISGNAPTGVRVFADVHHAWRGDLKLDLVAPDGRVHPLRAPAPKDSGDTIHEWYIVNASASPAKGTWKLRVQDTQAESTGSVIGWTMTF
ncbi:S8 family serine peptidase [Streptomyces sp. CS081A]|uniref:S8 family serine peptidase n=1 Tax=Streptomyces sp. CS081A TaxID=2162709 RepID=UPI0013A58D94|nr:S8 family serine peptidase [Streptomyces sp. CS081A]